MQNRTDVNSFLKFPPFLDLMSLQGAIYEVLIMTDDYLEVIMSARHCYPMSAS